MKKLSLFLVQVGVGIPEMKDKNVVELYFDGNYVTGRRLKKYSALHVVVVVMH